MTSIQFYHLTTTQIDRALPKLMEKASAGGFRTLIVAGNEKTVDGLDELLWIYDPASFLPHGTDRHPHPQAQPILLSHTEEPQNNATLLVITDGRQPQDTARWARVLDIFDGRNEEAVSQARKRWVSYKAAGHELTYLKQTETGGWQQPSQQ